jgi:hypothetical protein
MPTGLRYKLRAAIDRTLVEKHIKGKCAQLEAFLAILCDDKWHEACGRDVTSSTTGDDGSIAATEAPILNATMQAK